MITVRLTRNLPALLLLVMLTAIAAACGSDSGSKPAASGGATGGSGGTIKLGFSAWPGWFPWQVAKEAGIFDQVGLKVDLVWFESYTDSINAFTAGELDANSQTLNDTIAVVAAGADVRVVLVNDNSTGNDQVIVDQSITSIRDLKGKKIGVEYGVVDHYLLLLGLQSAGMTERDVEIAKLETGAAAAAFAAGQLDGVAVFAPFTTQALQRKGAKTLVSSADFPGAIPDHLVVSAKLATNRKQDVDKLVQVWFRTLKYIQEQPEKATAIMAKRAGVSVAEYRSYQGGTTIFTLEQNLAAFEPGSDASRLSYTAENISRFLMQSGLVEKAPDLSRLFDSSFVKGYAQGATSR